jgi:WD repeat-containing protein 23
MSHMYTHLSTPHTHTHTRSFKDIEARHIGWSILDIDYSPNNRFICYSTWSPYIQICNIHGDYELHEQLDMEPDAKRFSLFSMKFSSDNREILGGGCSRNAYLYDVERKQRVLRVEGHTDDINTVAWLSDSPNLFLTGSDDCLVKLWCVVGRVVWCAECRVQ